MAFKRFFVLFNNRTAVMDGKTKEIYRTPDVREARRLAGLLNELNERAAGQQEEERDD